MSNRNDFSFFFYIRELSRYFTLWSWIYFFLFPECRKNIIHSFICWIGAVKFTYIHPKKLYMPILGRYVQGKELILIDLLTHQSFIVFVYINHQAFIFQPFMFHQMDILLLYLLLFFRFDTYAFQLVDILLFSFLLFSILTITI